MILGGGSACLLVPAFERQRQADLCKFEASLVYIASSGTTSATQRSSVSKKKRKQQTTDTRKPKQQQQKTTQKLFIKGA